jgi:hypothetical protein
MVCRFLQHEDFVPGWHCTQLSVTPCSRGWERGYQVDFLKRINRGRTAWDKIVWVKASEVLARNVAPSSSRMEEVECRKLSVV